jgi:hypothetical protein
MRLFFAEMKDAVNSTFYAIHDEVEKAEGRSSSWRASAVARALKYLQAPENESVIVDNILSSEDALATLTHSYNLAMGRFCTATGRGGCAFVPMQIFLVRLYQKLAGMVQMKRDYVSVMSYTERDSFLADVVRQGMNAAVTLRRDEGRGQPAFESVSTVKAAGSVVGALVGSGLTQAALHSVDVQRLTPFSLAI